jgi:hypothetical protein
MSLIIPANSASAAGGYAVDNSCRFDDGSSASMSRDQSANDAGTTTIGTLSVWIKMSAAGTEQVIYERQTDTSNYFKVWFENNKLLIQTVTSGSITMKYETNRLFRDPSAWMSIVVILDSTDGTAGDRQQIWINGVKETSFATSTNIGSSASFQINTGTGTDYIGKRSTGNYFDGYIAEFVWIDGTDYTTTSFGEFDEDSGIWKPIDVSGLTFGTNGFYLDFEDSANLGNDANGGTDFTVANLTAIDQTTDTPTNNFATGNILSPYANRTITDGSLTITSTTTQWTNICSTIGVSSGKWWIELKHTAGSYGGLGIVSPFPQTENNVIGDFSAPVIQQIGYVAASGDKKINNSTSSYGDTWVGTDDIVNMSLNLDDNELKFYKNGTVQDSGTAIAISSGYTYFVGTSNYNSSGSSFNFGNPAFSISSGNADANGYGNFEYAPPAGFLALCTANLSEVLG